MSNLKRRILLLNGPELDKLGEREPEIYGTATLSEIVEAVRETVEAAGLELVAFQSDCELELSEFIKSNGASAEGIIINPAILTHHSLELAEVLASVECHKVEVHLSNLYAREQFRHESFTAASCDGVIMGFGMDGYLLAIEQLLYMLGVPSVKE